MKHIIISLLVLLLASCNEEQINTNEMNILQDFEGNIIAGQSPNFLILENVVDYVTVDYTIAGISISNRYTAINGIVEINVIEVSRLVYKYNNDTYTNHTILDPAIYGEDDGYHLANLTMSIDDNGGNHIDKSVTVINASLQIGDATLMDDYVGHKLTEGMIDMPVWRTNAGQYYPNSVSMLIDTDEGPVILRYSVDGSQNPIIADCGLLVKWLNQKGGYSYWLFEGPYADYNKNKSLGVVKSNWTNRADSMGSNSSLGYVSENSLSIEQSVSSDYIDELRTLLVSPEVYIYTGDLVTDSWIKVINRSTTNKIVKGKTSTKIKVDFDLPEQYNILK